jgi:hypothetical protein
VHCAHAHANPGGSHHKWLYALKPGLVGTGGAASVVGGDAAGGPLGAEADPKLPSESADGYEAESVRARLRERLESLRG